MEPMEPQQQQQQLQIPMQLQIVKTDTSFLRRGYNYFIVSDPMRMSLAIYTDDVAKFEKNWKAEAFKWLSDNGYMDSFFSIPMKTDQGPNCKYL